MLKDPMTTYFITHCGPKTEFEERILTNHRCNNVEFIFLDDAIYIINLLQVNHPHTDYRIKDSHGQYHFVPSV